MADSKIDICNFALGLVSVDPIASFEDGTTESDAADTFYEKTVRQLLVLYGWTFATNYQELNISGNLEVVGEWSTPYQLPADCLEVRALKLNGLDVPFQRVQNYLYTRLGDDDLPVLEYTSRVDEDQFTEHFITLLQFRLAQLFAGSITRNTDLAAQWGTEYENMKLLMPQRDSGQQTSKAIAPSRFIRSRR